MENRTAISEISGKGNNLTSYIQIFEIFIPEISVPFDVTPGIFRNFSEIQQFSYFLETRSRLFRTICLDFESSGLFVE